MSWREKEPELLNSVRQVYEACRVAPSDFVTVLADTQKDRRMVDAFTLTGQATGANTSLLLMPTQPSHGDLPHRVEGHLLTSTIVFDLTTMSWMYSRTLKRVLDRGVRVLQVRAGVDSLLSRPPDLRVAARARRGAEWLGSCETVRVTSELGTDLTVPRGGRPPLCQKGLVDEAGTWDTCALSMVNIYPLEGGAHGSVVVHGTLSFGQRHYVLERPIRLAVADGRITEIERDGELSRALDDWFKKFNDPSVYYISHIGFGVDHRADISLHEGSAFESYMGGVVLAFGSNIVPKWGGKNPAPTHVDSVIHGANFFVDRTQLIERGQFTSNSGID